MRADGIVSNVPPIFHAERKAHLMARAAGAIARAAGIKSALPFRFSPRYLGRQAELRGEFTNAWLNPQDGVPD